MYLNNRLVLNVLALVLYDWLKYDALRLVDETSAMIGYHLDTDDNVLLELCDGATAPVGLSSRLAS